MRVCVLFVGGMVPVMQGNRNETAKGLWLPFKGQIRRKVVWGKCNDYGFVYFELFNLDSVIRTVSC